MHILLYGTSVVILKIHAEKEEITILLLLYIHHIGIDTSAHILFSNLLHVPQGSDHMLYELVIESSTLNKKKVLIYICLYVNRLCKL